MAKKENEISNKKKGHFLKDVKAELKKVVWPTAKQTSNNTVAVIAFTLLLALIVFVLDLCFDTLNKKAVTPLQEKITSSYNSSNEESSNEENKDENKEEGEDKESDDNKSEEEKKEDDGVTTNVTTESDKDKTETEKSDNKSKK